MSFERRFYHNGMIYEFKAAKFHHVKNYMPKNLSSILSEYFSYIFSDEFPDHIFNDSKVQRCSNFRIKYLKRGMKKILSENLVEEGLVKEVIRTKNGWNHNEKINPIIKELIQYSREMFLDFEENNFMKPTHDAILNKCLLSCEASISIETPVWTRAQSTISDFMKPSSKGLNFHHNCSLTGHIDLLLYDKSKKCLIVADYKPEGNFINSLPQVATYALILKKIMGLKSIKCISFRKEDAWYYDPEILRKQIENMIKELGNPKLKWRNLIKKL